MSFAGVALVTLVSLGALGAEPPRALDFGQCRAPSETEKKWFPEDFQRFNGKLLLCPIQAPKKKPGLFLLTVDAAAVEASLPEKAPSPGYPKALIVHPDGKPAGELPYAFPFDPPVTISVKVKDWDGGIPGKLEVHIEDPAVSGNQSLHLSWDKGTRNYVGLQEIPEERPWDGYYSSADASESAAQVEVDVFPAYEGQALFIDFMVRRTLPERILGAVTNALGTGPQQLKFAWTDTEGNKGRGVFSRKGDKLVLHLESAKKKARGAPGADLFGDFELVLREPQGRKDRHLWSLGTQQDKNTIVQAVLDIPQLEKYFHSELPGRVPLTLSTYLIGDRMTLVKFGKAVLLLPEAKLKGPHLRFTKFDCEGLSCSVAFEYPAEGISGSTVARKDAKGTWTLESTQISER